MMGQIKKKKPSGWLGAFRRLLNVIIHGVIYLSLVVVCVYYQSYVFLSEFKCPAPHTTPWKIQSKIPGH